MSFRIGLSGWQYDGWRGDFYPEGLPKTRQLEYVADRFDTVELNGSFYSLQRPSSYARWHDATPDGFVFAVKGGRFVTHFKQLRDVEAALANFFASGVLLLGAKLGPVLWQLPERVAFDPAVLEEFLQLLPRTHAEINELAQKHDSKPKHVHLEPRAEAAVRHALEVRSQTFRDDRYFALLEEYDVANVVSDSAKRFPTLEEKTTDFAYVRLHGDTELYHSRYSDEALDVWAAKCAEWKDGYVYFDNDAKGHAPYDALRLAERLT